jgi:uncharacterized protein (TIGR02266 family)
MDRTKRSHPRVPASAKVTMRTTDGRTATVEELSNISLGGVFVHMTDPYAFGEELQLEFELPERSRVIRCRGIVVWSSRATSSRPKVDADGRKGIGVRLMEIGIADMRALADYIERNLKL